MTNRTIVPIVAAVGVENDEGKYLIAPFESDRLRSDDDDDDDPPSIWTPPPETEEASWPGPIKEDDDIAIE
jgi:hypothetical protein